MGGPMITIAVRDEFVDGLTSPECVRLLENALPDDWAEAISRVLTEPDEARELADRARQQIAQEHPVSRQVQVLFETYERILTGGALKIGSVRKDDETEPPPS